MGLNDPNSFLRKIACRLFQKNIDQVRVTTLSGGCINSSALVETPEGRFFIKWNSLDKQDMFYKEALGLDLLSAHSNFIIPKVLLQGTEANLSFLLLEYIEPSHSSHEFWENYGIELVKLHKVTAKNFGLEFDNYIGALYQSNRQKSNWIDFFISERIKPQLHLALESGKISTSHIRSFNLFFNKLDELLIPEPPALIHGDLWNANHLNSQNKPVLIDPACYYAHREIEVAFTQLFGGFESVFYKSYMNNYPLEKGYQERFDIYNIYPLMVHVNLFDVSFFSEAFATVNCYI